jgi:hypothetical protein
MKKTFTAWSGHSPLLVSIISPGKAEIFFDKKVERAVLDHLPTGVTMDSSYSISVKDIKRRARAYLLAHYRVLKEATLKGLTAPEQLQMLELAIQLVPKTPPNKIMWKDKVYHLQKHIISLRVPIHLAQQIPPAEVAAGVVGVVGAETAQEQVGQNSSHMEEVVAEE